MRFLVRGIVSQGLKGSWIALRAHETPLPLRWCRTILRRERMVRCAAGG